MTNPTLVPQSDEYQQIHDGIIRLVDTARTETVRSINAIMTATYWEIGRRIVEFEQGGEARAAYGTQLIERLSVDLSQRYKRGFPPETYGKFVHFIFVFNRLKFRRHCLRNLQISYRSPKHSSSLVSVCPPLVGKNPDARTFYEKETLRNGWSVRQLDRQIATQFYERTLLSHDKSAMLQQPAPPSQTFCRSKPYATRSFWNFLT